MKQLAVAGDHDKITAVINLLTTEFTYSAQANHRKVFSIYRILSTCFEFVTVNMIVWFEFWLHYVGGIDRISCCHSWVD